MSTLRRPLLQKILLRCVGLGFFLVTLAFFAFYAQGGWIAVGQDDSRLSPSMRLALSGKPPEVESGHLQWREIKQGFDVSELSVLATVGEVDRILLARIDPAHFRFEVRTAPAGHTELGDWMSQLRAAFVINGSYFAPDGKPDTPLVSNGVLLGPQVYEANHGAFVVSRDFVGVRETRGRDWQAMLQGADHAMVSYPLLVAADGSARAKSNDRWLANRSFVAQDRSGKIIVGTTTEAFFSLERLGLFLSKSPLELSLALNLDGGPVACQAIDLNGFRRDFCGTWETATHDGELKLLWPVFGNHRRSTLPIVLAAFPK